MVKKKIKVKINKKPELLEAVRSVYKLMLLTDKEEAERFKREWMDRIM